MGKAMAMERMEEVMGLSVFGIRITVGDHRMSVSERTGAVVDLSTAITLESYKVHTGYIYN
jgi:hypothetical protein